MLRWRIVVIVREPEEVVLHVVTATEEEEMPFIGRLRHELLDIFAGPVSLKYLGAYSRQVPESRWDGTAFGLWLPCTLRRRPFLHQGCCGRGGDLDDAAAALSIWVNPDAIRHLVPRTGVRQSDVDSEDFFHGEEGGFFFSPRLRAAGVAHAHTG